MPGVTVNGPLSQMVAPVWSQQSLSHCAWAPACIAYGLPDVVSAPHFAVSRGGDGKPAELIDTPAHDRRHVPLQPDDEQAQQLRKLALHLAAQPVTSDNLHQPSMAYEQTGTEKESTKKVGSRLIWADEDVVPSPQRCTAAQALPQDQQDFHQQMLRKLALHLAAQEDGASKVVTGMEEDKSTSTPLKMPEPAQTPSPQRIFPVHTLSQQEQGFHKQMLQKLALHLAAQEDPSEVGQNALRCEQMMADLSQSSDGAKSAEVMDWVLLTALELSFTKSGSRVVQRALEMATVEQRKQFVEKLLPQTTKLYMSPHANHVLAKLVQIMPPKQLACVAAGLRGHATTVARHQFGCRILERLIEHCSEEHIGFLLDELVLDLEAIARHQYGNFVAQHILEHGDVARKNSCAEALLPHVLQHSTHRTACSVVQKLLEHADLGWQAEIADAFLAAEGELSMETIAATRYGSFVVQKLVDVMHPRVACVKARIKLAHPQLQESGFSRRKIVEFLGEDFFRD